jgi:tRNA (pseudouridine54-N1)-methyltransferase
MRHFVIIGRTATASPDFSLEDLPSTSGRLDVLLRCVRAALLVSHGVRRDTSVYLVLLGGGDAPATLRFDGASAHFLRPDERSLAVSVKKSLAERAPAETFTAVRRGIALARGGLEAVLADLPPCAKYVLEQGGEDIRQAALPESELAIFVGDHLGFDESCRETLKSSGARALSLGPLALHAEDAVTVTCNELDRRGAP